MVDLTGSETPAELEQAFPGSGYFAAAASF